MTISRFLTSFNALVSAKTNVRLTQTVNAVCNYASLPTPLFKWSTDIQKFRNKREFDMSFLPLSWRALMTSSGMTDQSIRELERELNPKPKSDEYVIPYQYSVSKCESNDVPDIRLM